MTPEELRNAIRALLTSHPNIAPSPVGHAAHAERYLTKAGQPIGFEPERVRFQNLWVRADGVRRHVLGDIDNVLYQQSDFAVSKPNHNLFGEPAFKDCDLLCFKVTDLWQAARIVLEVAGEGGAA